MNDNTVCRASLASPGLSITRRQFVSVGLTNIFVLVGTFEPKRNFFTQSLLVMLVTFIISGLKALLYIKLCGSISMNAFPACSWNSLAFLFVWSAVYILVGVQCPDIITWSKWVLKNLSIYMTLLNFATLKTSQICLLNYKKSRPKTSLNSTHPNEVDQSNKLINECWLTEAY